MISVIIATHNSERDLVEALSPLVPASVDGLVRELIAVDAGSTDSTLEILEDAGALIVQGGQAEACAAAKGPWLLLIEPGSRLTHDWLSPVRRRLEDGSGKPARLARRGLFAKTEAVLIRKQGYRGGKVAAPTLRI